jgi:Protein of unknown function DUF262
LSLFCLCGAYVHGILEIVTKLAGILHSIDSGTVLLPEFQRGYVWNRDQVRGLMRSLYLGYPVGSLLTWETQAEGSAVRGDTSSGSAVRLLILDGQQRLTTLYGVTRGRPPSFFQGDGQVFSGLRFNVETEGFEFYAPAKMRDDPRWIDVTSLFVHGLDAHFTALNEHPDTRPNYVKYTKRLGQLERILEHEVHEERLTGADKTVNVVVEIFNKVNSGGTKLSKGDLALAKKCAQWPQARGVMQAHLERWAKDDFEFGLDWLLRNVTAVATGRSEFATLDDVSDEEFKAAIGSSAAYVGTFLDAMSGRLGLDHDRVLMTRGAFPVISRLLHLRGGRFADSTERDQALYWYVQSALWGRFASSTETVLNQDYETLAESGVTGLIGTLERSRGGNLAIDGDDFDGYSVGSRFYPLLYLLTRVCGARDFGSGLPLHSHLLGRLSSLQVHHVFPKALLYEAEYEQRVVNAVANFAFLTQDSNLTIGKRRPEEYFAAAEAKHPGVLESQWIPLDPELWRVENYRDFLEARRELLAAAANSFLDQLRSGSGPGGQAALSRIAVVDSGTGTDQDGSDVAELVRELVALGCAEPAIDCEVPEPADGSVLTIANACWPEGLQPGQGGPVVLILDRHDDSLGRLRELGYEVFDSTSSLLGFVRLRNQEAAGPAAEPGEPLAPASQVVVPDKSSAAEFEKAARGTALRARDEAHYNPAYFMEMLATLGGVGTAKRLLHSKDLPVGFTRLWELGRLDLTIEALVVQSQFRDLFTTDEVAVARKRLDDLGYRA